MVAHLVQHRILRAARRHLDLASAGSLRETGRSQAMITARKYGKPVGLLALLGVAIAFPLVFSDPTYTTIAVFALIFASAASGWNIFAGYTGYIALGHAAYFGIGAYALAIICQDWHILGGYMPFLLVPVAGLLAAIAAIPLGGIALRVRRH